MGMAIDKTRCDQASATINSFAIKFFSNSVDGLSCPDILDAFAGNDNKSVVD
jgi:hypothetical protein